MSGFSQRALRSPDPACAAGVAHLVRSGAMGRSCGPPRIRGPAHRAGCSEGEASTPTWKGSGVAPGHVEALSNGLPGDPGKGLEMQRQALHPEHQASRGIPEGPLAMGRGGGSRRPRGRAQLRLCEAPFEVSLCGLRRVSGWPCSQVARGVRRERRFGGRPGWRNGRRGGLKNLWAKARASSSLALGMVDVTHGRVPFGTPIRGCASRQTSQPESGIVHG